jgi:NO-binding membrane sensor protein with MHYT domain
MLFGGSDTSTMIYLSKTYDPLLVLLSLVIAIVASFTAFGTTERTESSPSKSIKVVWLSFGAFALGIGIWAMHFIGMLALNIGVPVNYDVTQTLLSTLPGILVSFVILFGLNKVMKTRIHALLGGALFGLGVTIMHVSGMRAMEMNATMTHHSGMLLMAFVLSALLASGALHLQIATRGTHHERIFDKHQLFSAILLGCAVTVMHYMAMNATEFLPSDTSRTHF